MAAAGQTASSAFWAPAMKGSRSVISRSASAVAPARMNARRRGWTLRGRARQRVGERGARALAAHREDDALPPAAAREVALDLLGLDGRGLVEREAADARAERDERQR